MAGRDAGTLEWGLALQNRGPLIGVASVPELLELARMAEASGLFGSVWVGDSLLDRPRLDAVAMLGAVAAVTERIRIGVSCCASMVVRHPIQVAVQWASIDVLSGGRSIWAPCLGGGVARELAPFGVERRERIDRLEEMLHLIRRLWTEDEVTHEGRFFRFSGVRAEPKPLQKPHPPLWYAVTPDDERLTSEAVDLALERALRYADGWQGADTDPEQIGRLCARLRSLGTGAGGEAAPEFPCSTHVSLTIADTMEEAWRLAKWYFAQYYPQGFYRHYEEPERLIRRRHTWGPPGQCAARLREFAQTGCSTIIVRFAAPDQRTQLRRFVREVAPLVMRVA